MPNLKLYSHRSGILPALPHRRQTSQAPQGETESQTSGVDTGAQLISLHQEPGTSRDPLSEGPLDYLEANVRLV